MDNISEKRPNILGLVLARNESKGVRHKNRYMLAGKPLISWVIQPMKQCKFLDEVWVSTDDEQIAEIARTDGVNVFNRHADFATDEASSVSAIEEFLNDDRGKKFDVIALVQCTSPCLHPCYLDEGMIITISLPFSLSI